MKRLPACSKDPGLWMYVAAAVAVLLLIL